ELEYAQGQIEAKTLINPDTAEQWHGLLAATNEAPTFALSSGDGIVTTDFSGSDTGYSMIVQSDGKIVVAGKSDNDVALARYNADGSLDTTFGSGGILTTDFGSGSDNGQSVTVQSDDKILVAGYSWNGSDDDFALTRYNANGSLDTTFGSGGILTTDFGSGSDNGQSVTVQSDGKILVAGYSWNGGNTDFALTRYNTDGSLDTTFDGDGILTTGVRTGGDFGHSVTVQSDGKILVAGHSWNRISKDFDFALTRYNANGSLDTTF
ncbi:MAG: hypothetical protein GY759_06420, partial [Chloroflexi bacterium]|nr:hypothetical protein [Chloroflexota bacterium]